MSANTVQFLASIALEYAYKDLIPGFEKQTGIKVETEWSTSVKMLDSLKGGQVVDLIGLSAQSIDALIEAGVVAKGSRVDVATSSVGIGVKQGAPRPDTSTMAKLLEAVLAAPSVGISTGPSGIYLKKLFEKQGILPQLGARLQVITPQPVGEWIAAGKIALGFQQMTELKPVAGVDFWAIPDEAQSITTFSLGTHAKAPHPEATRKFVEYLSSVAAGPVYAKHGAKPLRG